VWQVYLGVKWSVMAFLLRYIALKDNECCGTIMRFLILIFTVTVLFGTGVFAPTAQAQSKKELAAHIAQLSERLRVMENRVLTGDPAAERLTQRMDALETSQRSLTGEVERLRYERDTLQEEVRALAAQIAEMNTLSEDMKRHLKAVEIVASQPGSSRDPIVYGGGRVGGGVYDGSSIPGPPSIVNVPSVNADIGGNTQGLAGSGTGAPRVDSRVLAQLGQDKMAEGDFGAAQAAFSQYIQQNPTADDVGDIYFWLGETYYVKSGFADAADAYIASMRADPKGIYAPDAMVRLAASARQLGKPAMACQTLNSFPKQYPRANSSVKAKARLEKQRSGC
jgi:tol-pal system protein YbgF